MKGHVIAGRDAIDTWEMWGLELESISYVKKMPTIGKRLFCITACINRKSAGWPEAVKI